MEQIIMHIDVNNAFLSWTAIDLLNRGHIVDIRNTYAVIGGDESKRHGIVLAKSTPAKKKGIVTAETIYSARQKCPSLEVYPPNHKWYEYESKSLFELLSKYTPDIEVFSIDECAIDYTPVRNLYGGPLEFANKLKDEIKNKLGFTVNIGIANNKLCAKMASDFSKPDKVHTLWNHEIEDKMYPLPVGELLWIGRKTVPKLESIGIKTIGDLAKSDHTLLKRHFKNQAHLMIESAKGIDYSKITPEKEAQKGISQTTTLERNYTHIEELYPILHAISENISHSLRSQKKYGNVVAIIIKDKHFKSYSHQEKLVNATNNSKVIYDISKKLLSEAWNEEAIRLIGIRVDNLKEEIYHQVSLFEDVEVKEKTDKIEEVVDQINSKYGTKMVKKASLINKKDKI